MLFSESCRPLPKYDSFKKGGNNIASIERIALLDSPNLMDLDLSRLYLMHDPTKSQRSRA